MKVVINKCWGGFRLSDKAIDRLKELAEQHKDKLLLKLIEENTNEEDERYKYWGLWEINRTHPLLIKVVEELGEEANTNVSELKIVEIPDNIEWEIEEYDGIEWISEKHRTWG